MSTDTAPAPLAPACRTPAPGTCDADHDAAVARPRAAAGSSSAAVRLLPPDADPLDLAWRELAACAGRGVELFFPVGHTKRALRDERRAKAVCATCAVRALCLEFSLRTYQNDGIWGGCSEDERRELRRARRRALRGA